MEADLESRVRRLEESLQQMQAQLATEKARAARVAQRERWARIALVVIVGAAYVFYLRFVSGIA